MSDRPAIILATYANWRTIPSRKVLQLVFEIPIEQQQSALTILGAPSVDTAQWYAIAKFDQKVSAGGASTKSEGPDTGVEPTPPPSPVAADQERVRKHFSDYDRSQQAAIKCQDDDFCSWLFNRYGAKFPDANLPDALLKAVLGITSKKQLDVKEHSYGEIWDRMLTDFDYKDRT